SASRPARRVRRLRTEGRNGGARSREHDAGLHVGALTLGEHGIPGLPARDRDAEVDPLSDGELERRVRQRDDALAIDGDGLGAEATRAHEEVGAAGAVDDAESYRASGKHANDFRIRERPAI